MRARTTTFAIVLAPLLALSACDGPTPTEPAAPSIQLVRAHASIANNGKGARFDVLEPGYGIPITDADGNVCYIVFSTQEGGKSRNDFIRYNKNGSVSIHVSDQAAEVDLSVNGKPYKGVGFAQATATSNPEGTAWEQFVVNATGEVTDPSDETHIARCTARGHDPTTLKGSIRVK